MIPAIISIPDLLQCTQPMIVIIREFRLGDIVAFEPVIGALRKKYPNHQLAFAAHYDYIDALIAHPYLTYIVPVNNTADIVAASREFPKHISSLLLDFHRSEWGELGNTLSKQNPKVLRYNYYFWDGLLGMVAKQTGLPKTNAQPHFYIQDDVEIPFMLPAKYVAFHTGSQDSSRDWQAEKWVALAEYFIAQGIAVVELGWVPMIYMENSLFYNGTKLGLHQTARIIKGTHCFFGIDSGLAHVANALQVDGVCLLGVLDRMTLYTQYIPYTGKYSCGHIIRAKGLRPAAELTVEEVIKFYETKNSLFSRFLAKCVYFFISNFYNRFMRCSLISRSQRLRHFFWYRKKFVPRRIDMNNTKPKPESWFVGLFTYFKKQARMRRQIEQLVAANDALIKNMATRSENIVFIHQNFLTTLQQSQTQIKKLDLNGERYESHLCKLDDDYKQLRQLCLLMFRNMKQEEKVWTFIKEVKQVVFEITNSCNLKCPYCPNILNINGENDVPQRAPMALLEKVLRELHSVEYSQGFYFHAYNEPLYDYDFFLASLRLASRVIPRAEKYLFTNTTCLTQERLTEIVGNGISSITATLHFTGKWDFEAQKQKVLNFCKANSLRALKVFEHPDKIEVNSIIKNVKIRVHSVNFYKAGMDRGGLLSNIATIPRNSRCAVPRAQFNINYLGDVYPCCNIYPRINPNKGYIMGNVADASIFDIYNSHKYQDFINTVTCMTDEPANNSIPSPCANCTDYRWI